jgi:iron complex outermembrane receptor protein
MGAQQTLHFGDFKLVGGVDTQYRSSRYVQVEFLPEELVGDTWTTNAQLAFGPQSEKWQIAAFIRNIENNRIVVNTPIYAFASSLETTTSAPRTYGLRLNYSF